MRCKFMGQSKVKDINYALVEDKRPPIYRCLKYWGKKPHNIWNKYIENYTRKDGLFLDPFSGSAMSAFESFVAGRKAIAVDINPLTSFVIETMCSDFDEEKFKFYVHKICSEIENDLIYKQLYIYKNDYKNYFIHNIKWENSHMYEVCIESFDGKDRKCLTPSEDDLKAFFFSEQMDISLKYPNDKFRDSVSFTRSFLENVGESYDKLYTKRNLWVLATIFDKIVKIKDEDIKIQLLYSFIQICHLSTKMCVPRSKKTNRDFSTSWGRAAFIYSKKQMEMNPLQIVDKMVF